jgi:hypothetical protein
MKEMSPPVALALVTLATVRDLALAIRGPVLLVRNRLGEG